MVICVSANVKYCISHVKCLKSTYACFYVCLFLQKRKMFIHKSNHMPVCQRITCDLVFHICNWYFWCDILFTYLHYIMHVKISWAFLWFISSSCIYCLKWGGCVLSDRLAAASSFLKGFSFGSLLHSRFPVLMVPSCSLPRFTGTILLSSRHSAITQ